MVDLMLWYRGLTENDREAVGERICIKCESMDIDPDEALEQVYNERQCNTGSCFLGD